MAKKLKKINNLTVETLKHDEATRKNIPTAEHQSVMHDAEKSPIRVAYERRNRDLDPQLVWRGKDEKDWSDLVVHAPPLYIQEKVQPKVLIDDLMRRSKADAKATQAQVDLFADFNGLPNESAKTEFYQHDAHWANRMILGDSLQVMASLAEREGLRGKVQMIYFDPPYGIKFNSNFQWSTISHDVKDGKVEHITREPEQVKAFRDTWRDGIHSYLTYLRDRLTVARDLLTESGSIFVQIGDENVHRVRAVMDEVFGDQNFVNLISFVKTAAQSADLLPAVMDYVLHYAKDMSQVKHRNVYRDKLDSESLRDAYSMLLLPDGTYKRLKSDELVNFAGKDGHLYRFSPLVSQRPAGAGDLLQFSFQDKEYSPGKGTFKSDADGLNRLSEANRLQGTGNTLFFRLYLSDFPCVTYTNNWTDTQASFSDRIYVVQTNPKVVQRCILMTTDPGDLVLDPTCGSGTAAYVSEQWGRRWITIDTSRVALALARARIMGARYPYYLLADSSEGQLKEAEVTRTVPSSQPTRDDIRQGFVCERVPHITLKSISNNTEIDVIWEKYQETLKPLREQLNKALNKKWEEWEISREVEDKWSDKAKKLHAEWWKQRIARQEEIDASISAKAEFEYLYDKPYNDKKKVRVAGPFTVESLSPHRAWLWVLTTS